MDIIQKITQELKVEKWQVEAAVIIWILFRKSPRN